MPNLVEVGSVVLEKKLRVVKVYDERRPTNENGQKNLLRCIKMDLKRYKLLYLVLVHISVGYNY